MSKKLDILGKKFGMLKVLKEVNSKNGRTRWECLCDCGNIKVFTGANLGKSTLSCGCRKKTGDFRRVHGMRHSSFYKTWCNMKTRCFNKRSKSYKDYGERGIAICNKWLKFEGFMEDMLNGYEEELTLDRIDNDGNYEKNNCRWATKLEQNNNRRKRRCYPKRDKKGKFIKTI